MNDSSKQFDAGRSSTLRVQSAIWFAVSIAAIGAVMMALTSSPSAKGASFLWLPAALQLIAGVWLGPWLGLLAGGLGAYTAGILAYGGWGVVDIIMNPVAGGIANAWLPAVLFRAMKIDPTFGYSTDGDASVVFKPAGRIGILLLLVLILAFVLKPLQLGPWGYAVPLVLVLIAPLVISELRMPNVRSLGLAIVICVVISAISAVIGSWGQVVGGKPFVQALVETGLGWFLGDSVSAILGLYLLAVFTGRAREAGISSI